MDSLQAEWQYLCHCVPGVEAYLQPIKDPIREKLLPVLLDVNALKFVGDFRVLLTHSVNCGGLNVHHSVEGGVRLHQSSAKKSSMLVKSLQEGSVLD
ncbi:hypothetical protein ACHAWF_000504 [Thalassiosira exigua]